MRRVYGKGENVRDWLYVVDHARAIDIIKVVIKTVDRLLGRKEGEDSLGNKKAQPGDVTSAGWANKKEKY